MMGMPKIAVTIERGFTQSIGDERIEAFGGEGCDRQRSGIDSE